MFYLVDRTHIACFGGPKIREQLFVLRRKHYHHGRVFVPHHAPEIGLRCAGNWMLRDDEFLQAMVALHHRCIDVAGAFGTSLAGQNDTT